MLDKLFCTSYTAIMMIEAQTTITSRMEDAMNDLVETFTLVSGYDHKTVSTFRKFTIEDIKHIRGEQYIIDKRGEYRRCRPNGSVRTWKRDPNRFECSFKYGMYEYFRLNTEEMLQQLVVMV